MQKHTNHPETPISPRTAASTAKQYLYIGLLLILGAVAYHNSLNGAFVFDDQRVILNKAVNIHFTPLWKSLFPPRGSLLFNRPLLHFTLALNFKLNGLNPYGYHIVNVLIHLLAGLVLFGVIRRTLLLPKFQHAKNPNPTGFAFICALLWLLHPIQTQSVNYLIQRGESQMGLFYLLTFYCYLRSLDSDRPVSWKALSLIACFLGVGSKQVMVTAPFLLILFNRLFICESWQQLWKRHKGFHFFSLLTLLLYIWPYLTRSGAQRLYRSSAGFDYVDVSAFQYFFSQGGVILHYLRLILWPSPLVFDYDWSVAKIALPSIFAVIAVTLMALASMVAMLKKSTLGFVAFWFFAILAPTSSIMPIRDLCVEHRVYLSSAGVIILLVYAIFVLLNRFLKPYRQIAAVVLTAVISLTFISLTIRRNQDYRTEKTIWADTIKKSPQNARAFNNLGKAYMLSKEYQQAEVYVRRSLELKDENKSAYNNMGNLYSYQKQYEKAIPYYLRTLELDPIFAQPHNNLANAYAYLKQYDQAIAHYEKAIEYNPYYGLAFLNYGQLLNFQGDWENALKQLREAEKLLPSHVPVLLEISKSLGSLGQHQAALPYLEKVSVLQPQNADAKNLLGVYHIQEGDLVRAEGYFRAALQLNPNHPDARRNLAWFEQKHQT